MTSIALIKLVREVKPLAPYSIFISVLMIRLIMNLISTSARAEMGVQGRKWDFAGRKITFLIYCVTQTGRRQEGLN